MADAPRPGAPGAPTLLDAARGVLATLTASRAALLQVAAAHLPYNRLVALHRLAAHDDGAWLADAGGMLERRLALQTRAGGGRVPEVALPTLPPAPAPAPLPAPPPRRAAAPARPASRPAPPPPGGPEQIALSLLEERASLSRVSPASPTRSLANLVEEAHAPTPAEPTAGYLGVAEATGMFDQEALAAPPTVSPAEPAESALADASLEPLPSYAVTPDAPPDKEQAALDAPSAEDKSALAVQPEDAAAASVVEAPVLLAPEEPTGTGPVIRDESTFHDAGENTANWALHRPAVTIDDLLGATASPDATLLAPAPGSDLLSDWAADALGARPARPVPASESTLDLPPPRAREAVAPRLFDDDEPLPTLREGRVEGAPAAMVDVHAAGQRPRVARADEVEEPETTGDLGAPEPTSEESVTSGGFQVTFERGAPAKPRPSAPRLTDDATGERTNPGGPAPRPAIVPDEAQVHAFLAEAQDHARRGDLQKAIQAFTDALDMRPTVVEAHIGRGRCHLELGDYSSAMSDFARAEDLAPDRPDPHVATGDLYFARKEYKRAIEFYDQAVELDGSHAMARCRRGISHYYRKNYRQAFQDLQRALALDPEIPNIRKYMQMAQKKL